MSWRRGNDVLWLVSLAAAGLTLWCVTRTALLGLQAVWLDIVFVLIIGLGEVLRVRTPGGASGSAPMSLAAGAGLALLAGSYHGGRPAPPVCEAVTVVAAGMVLGSLVFALGRREALTARMPLRLVSVAVAGEVFHLVAGLGRHGHLFARPDHWWVVATLGAAALIGVLYLVLAALTGGSARASVRTRLLDELDGSALVCAAAVATASVIAIGSWDLGVWSAIIFSIPMLVTTGALRRYAVIRQTQAQTVRALSRAAEVAGYIEVGHSDRVADLSVRIGEVLGLRSRRLNELRSAALMHDIGQLSLREPIPGGATLLATGPQRVDIARRGAQVLERAAVLPAVARIMAEQAVPYCELADDSPVRTEAGVVAVANAYDDLVGAEPSFQRQAQALERLRLGAGSQYDPAVVEALEQVLVHG